MKMVSSTRREFIKTSALAAASVSFAGPLASQVRAAEPDRTGESDLPSLAWAI